MFARVSTYKAPTEDAFDKARALADEIVPQVKDMQGYRGMYYLADRDSRRSMSITLWDTEEDLRETARTADEIRTESAARSGEQILSVEHFEVVVDA